MNTSAPDSAVDIDWNVLRAAAEEARETAYAPYSKFPVGVAALAGGKILTGVNIENMSYPVTMCAENTLIATWYTGDRARLQALVCVSTEKIITPCGRCRQLLMEHAGPELVVLTARGETTLRALLPEAFEL